MHRAFPWLLVLLALTSRTTFADPGITVTFYDDVMRVGRIVRSLNHGPLARGVTNLTWDGGNESGWPLGAGLYFLRVSSVLGSSTKRIVRTR